MVRVLVAAAALGVLAGCSSGEVKIGVDVAAATTLQTRSLTVPSTTGSGTQTTGSDAAAAISRVRILVAEAKVGHSGGGCMGQGSSGGSEAGPFVIDLNADEIAKGAHRDFSLGSVSTGTYDGAEVEIEPFDGDADDGDTSAAEFADFRTSGASLLVDGTFNGKAFQFAGHFKAEQGTDDAVTVDAATPVSIPMSVDPASWFKAADGTAIDPTDAAQHDAIAVAICKTLDTEKEEAAPDHGGRHGHGGHGPRPHCVEAAAP